MRAQRTVGPARECACTLSAVPCGCGVGACLRKHQRVGTSVDLCGAGGGGSSAQPQRSPSLWDLGGKPRVAPLAPWRRPPAEGEPGT
eukprot:scaffold110255_cov60-Phaeocystis_antarctica.AAC.1